MNTCQRFLTPVWTGINLTEQLATFSKISITQIFRASYQISNMFVLINYLLRKSLIYYISVCVSEDGKLFLHFLARIFLIFRIKDKCRLDTFSGSGASYRVKLTSNPEVALNFKALAKSSWIIGIVFKNVDFEIKVTSYFTRVTRLISCETIFRRISRGKN